MWQKSRKYCGKSAGSNAGTKLENNEKKMLEKKQEVMSAKAGCDAEKIQEKLREKSWK